MRSFGKSHKFRRDISPGLAGNLTRFGEKSHEVWPEISRGLARNIPRLGRKSHKVGREISHVLAGNLTYSDGVCLNFNKIWRDLHEISQELGCHLTRFIPKSPEVRGRQEVYFLHFWGVVCLIQRALRF